MLTQRAIAARLDPVSPYAVEAVGRYYSAIGRYDTAVDFARAEREVTAQLTPL